MSKVNVRKCDRCDSLYEPYPISYPTIQLMAIKFKSKDGAIFGTGNIDLCENCLTELKAWFGKEVSFE